MLFIFIMFNVYCLLAYSTLSRIFIASAAVSYSQHTHKVHTSTSTSVFFFASCRKFRVYRSSFQNVPSRNGMCVSLPKLYAVVRIRWFYYVLPSNVVNSERRCCVAIVCTNAKSSQKKKKKKTQRLLTLRMKKKWEITWHSLFIQFIPKHLTTNADTTNKMRETAQFFLLNLINIWTIHSQWHPIIFARTL